MSEAERTQNQTQAAAGRLLAGRYRLGEVLGRGGMGTVWRAGDETLGRTVAIKELRLSSTLDEDEKQRLITRTLREAKAIARIRSSGAVTVYDVVDEDDRPWIVMELIEGSSLADVVRDTGGLTPHRAAEVALAVLDVLRAAHLQGVLHRDVKPSNVLIADDGRVVLTDFGIAQVEGDPSVTSTGMLVGAPSYISPERARGHKPGPPSDLWSLGGLLYACVEGVPPYDKGSALATLTAVMTEPLDPPAKAGPLKEVIHGLLAKDPAQRLDDAGARALLKEALAASQDKGPEPPVAAEPTRTMALPPTPERKPETSGEAEERLRGGLRSVRNEAAKSASASEPTPGTAAASADRTTPTAAAGSPTKAAPRRTLVIVAVIAALALLGTVLAFALSGGDDGGDGGNTKDDKAASDSSKAGNQGSPGPDESGPSDEPTSDSGGAEDKPGSDAGPGSGSTPEQDGLPDGFKEMTDSRFRFTMALPEGWKRTDIAGRNSGGIYTESGGFPRIQVDFTPSPGSDAVAAWKSQEPMVRSNSSGYRRLYIRKVDYRGYPTVADWAFERNQNGQRVRVLNRGFKVDSEHGYAIMITCRADAWDGRECSTLRATAFATFQPKD